MKPDRQPAQFLETAKMLANGNDPERLAVALASWARLVGGRNPGKDSDIEDWNLVMAARYLEQGLLPYALAGERFDLPYPECVDIVLNELTELIEFLEGERRPSRKGGQPPDSRRRVCAAVCAAAWHHYHGEAQPFSPKLQEACEVYWQSCGHPETGHASGSIRNWERFLCWAVDANDEEFREDFVQQLIGTTT